MHEKLQFALKLVSMTSFGVLWYLSFLVPGRAQGTFVIFCEIGFGACLISVLITLKLLG